MSCKITKTELNPHHVTEDHLDKIRQSNENYGLMVNGEFKQCVHHLIYTIKFNIHFSQNQQSIGSVVQNKVQVFELVPQQHIGIVVDGWV